MIINGTDYSGQCLCGRDHKMETILSVIESGCLRRVKTYMKEMGLSGFSVAVYDENTFASTSDRRPSVDCEIVQMSTE